MELCRPLNEYSWFTSRIRIVKKEKKEMTLEEAVDKVMKEVPEDFLIRPFLMANKAEVKRMCITEYNEERTMKLTFEEGREEGLEKGREEGRKEGRKEGREEGQTKEKRLTVINMLKEGLPNDLISKICRISIDDIALIAASPEAV